MSCPDCGRDEMHCSCIGGIGGERRCEECGETYNLEDNDNETLCLRCDKEE